MLSNIISPKASNIVAVIVTYHPDEDFHIRVKEILRQVDTVIIVDNNSTPECQSRLKNISNYYNMHLLVNTENLGVAKALNLGMDYAIGNVKNAAWCLTFDQDTLIYSNLVSNQIKAYSECPFRDQVGIIGSNYQEWTTDKILFDNKNENNSWAEVSHLPTSGCLTSLEIYKNVGGFRGNFFIDYVDTEFCLRLKYHGYRLLIVPDVCMKHPLGYYKKNSLYKILCGRSMVSNYPPFRHYYWSRNGIIVAKEYFWRETRWAVGQLYYIIFKRLLSVILFEDQKLKKIRNIFLGICHSFLKRFPSPNEII
jgi:rhamnosyltransferase